MFWILLGFLVAFLFYFIILKPLVPLLLLKIKYGDEAILEFIPLLGMTALSKRSYQEHSDAAYFHRHLLEKYPKAKIILTNFGIKPCIYCFSPQQFKDLTFKHDKCKRITLLADDHLLDQGLMFSNGKQWKFQRALLAQSFHYDQLSKNIPLINKITIDKMKQLDQEQNLDAINFCANITGEAVIQFFFGNDLKDLKLNNKSAQNEIIDTLADLGSLRKTISFNLKKIIFGLSLAWKLFPTDLQKDLKRRIAEILSLSQRIIDNRIMNSNGSGDFLDLHIQKMQQNDPKDEVKVTKEIITQQFLTLFFAGTDTTAHLAALVLFFCAEFQDVQEELYQEILSVVGKTEDVTASHLNQLKKLTAFVNESFRYRQPVAGLFPRTITEDTFINDIKIKKGWLVFYQPNFAYFNDKYFDNPHEFNYRRWLTENPIKDKELAPFIFAPFSSGGRNCIGQHMALIEAKIIICHMIRTFKIIHDQEKRKNLKWKMRFLYSFEPQDMMQLKRRN